MSYRTQNFKLVPVEPSKDDILQAMDNAEIAGYDWVDDYRPSISDVEAILKQYPAAAPDVANEPVAWLKEWQDMGTRKRVDLTPSCEDWLKQYSPKITPLYTTPQPDRTAELEAERDSYKSAMEAALEEKAQAKYYESVAVQYLAKENDKVKRLVDALKKAQPACAIASDSKYDDGDEDAAQEWNMINVSVSALLAEIGGGV